MHIGDTDAFTPFLNILLESISNHLLRWLCGDDKHQDWSARAAFFLLLHGCWFAGIVCSQARQKGTESPEMIHVVRKGAQITHCVKTGEGSQ